jgi:hypothetical protein
MITNQTTISKASLRAMANINLPRALRFSVFGEALSVFLLAMVLVLHGMGNDSISLALPILLLALFPLLYGMNVLLLKNLDKTNQSKLGTVITFAFQETEMNYRWEGKEGNGEETTRYFAIKKVRETSDFLILFPNAFYGIPAEKKGFADPSMAEQVVVWLKFAGVKYKKEKPVRK